MKKGISILIFLVFNTVLYAQINKLELERNSFDAVEKDTLNVKTQSENLKSTNFYFTTFYNIPDWTNVSISPLDTNKNVAIKDGNIEWHCSNKPGIHKINLNLIVNEKIKLVRLERNIIDINNLDTSEIINKFNTAISFLDRWIIDEIPLANVYNRNEYLGWSDDKGNLLDTIFIFKYDDYLRQDEVLKSINFLESLTEIESTISLRTSYQVALDCYIKCSPNVTQSPICDPEPCGQCWIKRGRFLGAPPIDLHQVHYTNPEVC